MTQAKGPFRVATLSKLGWPHSHCFVLVLFVARTEFRSLLDP